MVALQVKGQKGTILGREHICKGHGCTGIGHICATVGKQRYLSLKENGSMTEDKMAVKAQITLGPNKYV